MKCGETIFVKDWSGAWRARFIAQCEGRFMEITHSLDGHNGYILGDWKGVLRELVALAVPAKLTEHVMQVESTAGGMFIGFPLTYPLSVKGLADLLGVDAADVRGQLEDMAVNADG
jgi:hypothetical protein